MGLCPRDVSFPTVADKLDNFCATYVNLSLLHWPANEATLVGRGLPVCTNKHKNKSVSPRIAGPETGITKALAATLAHLSCGVCQRGQTLMLARPKIRVHR